MDKEKLLRIGKNFIRYTLPAVGIFFYQLSIGVDFKAALGVGALAGYGLISDFIKKYSE